MKTYGAPRWLYLWSDESLRTTCCIESCRIRSVENTRDLSSKRRELPANTSLSVVFLTCPRQKSTSIFEQRG